MSDIVKLIELVRERGRLYDLSNEDYKNRDKKAKAWLEISMEMGTGDGKHWSSKWKSMRDNYNKYKKNTEIASGQAYKKYKNWPWAVQMSFLDDFNYRRTTGGNTNSRTRETNHKDSQSSTTENINFTLEESQVSGYEVSENVPGSELRERKMKNTAEPTDKILEYLKFKNDQKPQMDEVDHFFSSYAITFKKLPSRMQSMLKLEIATLFARYELQAEGDTSAGSSQITPDRGFDLSQHSRASPLYASSTELERPLSATPNLTSSAVVARAIPPNITVQRETASASENSATIENKDNIQVYAQNIIN